MQQKHYDQIIGVQVFLERRSTRLFVGSLQKEKNVFCFKYDPKYLQAKNVIPLGPEMPLSKQVHRSETLFTAFVDRIPSRENPAFSEYCEATGIAVDEEDPFILLTHIAHRGPSSFVFEPLYADSFTAEDLLAFRKALGLTVREFAVCFDFSQAALTRVERKNSSGREVLKRAKIYARFPEVALDQIRRKGGTLSTEKLKKAMCVLQPDSLPIKTAP